MTDFRFTSFQFRRKKKTPLPKEFVNEIWLIIRDHDYINLAELQIGKFYSRGILGETFLPHPKMLIYAN